MYLETFPAPEFQASKILPVCFKHEYISMEHPWHSMVAYSENNCRSPSPFFQADMFLAAAVSHSVANFAHFQLL